MPNTTLVLLKATFQKPPLSLKQFMLRSEVLKLYRGFMRLGRLMDTSPGGPECNQLPHPTSPNEPKSLHPLQLEWVHWVRSEFKLRQNIDDEEVLRMQLAHGKRQLQEMERTIMLATNKNIYADKKSAISEPSCSKQANPESSKS